MMYEADEYTDNGATAVDIGLGNTSAELEASKRKQELSLSVAERLRLQTEQSSKRIKVTGGAVKEATYVPKSAKKKRDKAQQQQEAAQHDRTRRSRRGVKELGLKTPFKHLAP